MSWNLDLGRLAERGVLEAQFEVVAQIGAALNPAAAARSAAEEIAKAEDIAQNIAEIGEHAGIETTEAASCRSTDTGMSETIIL